MTTTTMPNAPTVTKIDAPSGLETCDRCVADALWRVAYAPGELLFCGHHGRRYGFAGADSHFAYTSPVKLIKSKGKGKSEIKDKKGK